MLQTGPLPITDNNDTLPIPEAATSLCVSEASVRNWIKTGYLHQTSPGRIDRASFDEFVSNVVGREKLTLRANKSQSDDHDHSQLSNTTLADLADTTRCPSELAQTYESSLSNSHRNKEGIYYTPSWICDDLFSRIPRPFKGETFCDPCCGSGNFLLAAYHAGIHPENIYGFDTDPIAVEIAKARFKSETGITPKNIICCDYLLDSMKSQEKEYDIIITNPPWGKKLPKSEKQKYGEAFSTGRSLDTCSLFFFAALANLAKGGYIGLLLPESFFSIKHFQDARHALLQQKILAIFDFGKPFKGLLTKARAFIAKKEQCNSNNEVTCCIDGLEATRLQSSFSSNPSEIINISSTYEDDLVLKRIFSKPHKTLAGNARWGLGIVTGNNKKYCRATPGVDLMPVFKGAEIFPDRLASPSNYIPKDTSLYQQVAPRELYEADEKVIYRFISSNLVFHFDDKQSYILNSANLFVVNDDFPISAQKVANLFNLPIYNWVFRKVFDTHKVLRSDIECLPIYFEFLNSTSDLTEEALLQYLKIEKDADGTYRIKE